jgi:holin-like protein
LSEIVMLLPGLTWLVFFQLLGTALNHLLLPMLPGPIIGLVLLLAFLMLRGEVSEPLGVASASLLRYLPLLLVPPAVGVMVYASDIAASFWAIAGALLISVLVSMAFCGWLMQRLMRRHHVGEDAS